MKSQMKQLRELESQKFSRLIHGQIHEEDDENGQDTPLSSGDKEERKSDAGMSDSDKEDKKVRKA